MTFREKMKKLGSCTKWLDWIGYRTFDQYWTECERADWMMWELGHRIAKRQLVGLAGKLVDTVSHLYTSDNIVRDCIKATQEYAEGKIDNEEELRIHSEDAFDAACAATGFAAACAAHAASSAAHTTGFAAVRASHAASYAARAAGTAGTAAERNHHKLMCDMIREEV